MSQLNGTLKAKNPFAPPFQQICQTCKESMLQHSLHCTTCKQKTNYTYEHSIDCTLETDDGKIECSLWMPLLQQYCPAITEISFEDYTKSISATVYHLRKLSLEGTFTLALDNTITEINISQR